MIFDLDIDDAYFPMKAFFASIGENYFVSFLQETSKGIGSGFNDSGCELPGEEGDDEQNPPAVKFYTRTEEVLVPIDLFLSALRAACSIFISRHKEQEICVAMLLESITARLLGKL